MGESMALEIASGPKQARGKQTKEKIIQAATELFEKQGYEKTTSNEIAALAGVSVGSFYVYFSDKRQLLLTVFDRLADELFENTYSIVGPEDLFDPAFRSRIRQAVAKAIVDKQKNAGLHRVISEMALKDAEFADRQKAAVQRSISKLRELISLAKKAGLTPALDVDAAAFAVHRVVFDLSQYYVTGPGEFDKERAMDAASDMIYRFLFNPRD